MAPVTGKTYTPIEEKGKFHATNGTTVADFSNICVGDYLLGKMPQKSFLEQRLDEVRRHNTPIKQEIELYSEKIKEGKRELAALEREYSHFNGDIEEKEGLRKMIKAKKSTIWSWITSNCRRAWDLQRV